MLPDRRAGSTRAVGGSADWCVSRSFRSSAGSFCARPFASQFFHHAQHLQERPDVFLRHAAAHGTLERRQMLVDLRRDIASLRRRLDDERPPVVDAHVTRDEPTLGEPIENAGQRRTLVREAGVEVGDCRGRGGRQVREDVRFSLREAMLAKVSEIQADAMRRAVDWGNQA